MDLFLSVGAGSARENQLIVVEYSPTKAKKSKTIALVGKGVTFDTGGISIKPSLKMEDMKHDMTGAATMMGAVLLAAEMKVPNKVVALLGMTENMPSGTATVPSSVFNTRNGKTVEVLNTDAEGRLVLADVLDYAHDFKPDVIIDAATLTGAVNIALGIFHSAIFTDDKELERSLRDIGASNREGLWPLPMTDDYLEDMKSDVADLRNHVNHAYGGTCRAAAFLKQFIKDDTKWVHIDMANTANDQTYVPYWPKKGATGIFVRTLAQFAAEY
jgi:leucyl aminopeptidase